MHEVDLAYAEVVQALQRSADFRRMVHTKALEVVSQWFNTMTRDDVTDAFCAHGG